MVRNYESGIGDNRPSKITWQKLKPSQGKTKLSFIITKWLPIQFKKVPGRISVRE